MKLSIVWSYENWYAVVNDTQIQYRFLGATAEDQIVNVRLLQNAMTNGADAVNTAIPEIFDQVNVDNAPEVVQELFGGTNELFFQADFVYEAGEESASLLGDIEEAGEALAAFL